MEPTDQRAFRAVLAVLGALATVAGARGVVRGAVEVPDPGTVTASVDSEYRFYAAWYHVAGIVLLGAARRPERSRFPVRATSGALLLAACGRLISIRRRGVPHPSQVLLLVIELALPALLVPWQRRVERAPAPLRTRR